MIYDDDNVRHLGEIIMNIALCHFRVGETDGVSLEMEKWKLILERQGHNVLFLAGSAGTGDSHIIEELHYAHPINNKIVKNAYRNLTDYSESELLHEIEGFASIIEKKLIDFISQNKIDIIVPNNIWSLGWGLPAGIGFTNAVVKTNTRCITHHHDFYWERDNYSKPTCTGIAELLDTYFPPNFPTIEHCVINNIAKKEIKIRKNIDATVVPNVFDFSADPWIKDDYNGDFRESIGVDKNDILLLQATRITERKAIELAVDTAGKLKSRFDNRTIKLFDGRTYSPDNRVVLVLAGLPESENCYVEKIKEKAAEYKLDIVFCNDIVEHSRCYKDGIKQYSLWDVYVHADFITYPSILEGWGNQFLEAVFAKKPILVFEYPVYVTDISQHNFKTVSLGDSYKYSENHLATVDEKIIDNAANEMESLLTDGKLLSSYVDVNFNIATREFSYESLGKILSGLFTLA